MMSLDLHHPPIVDGAVAPQRFAPSGTNGARGFCAAAHERSADIITRITHYASLAVGGAGYDVDGLANLRRGVREVRPVARDEHAHVDQA